MIVVEIPKALAERPEVVPVDDVGIWIAPDVFGSVRSLVDQRIALAWRETCPTCGGDKTWERGLVGRCPDCTTGYRMVVGWTAEVEAVVPIVGPQRGVPPEPCVERFTPSCVRLWRQHLKWTMLAHRQIASHATAPNDDWTPGRFALVLRDVEPFRPDRTRRPVGPFDGFADLESVLS